MMPDAVPTFAACKHPKTEENLGYYRRKGARTPYCRQCARERRAEWGRLAREGRFKCGCPRSPENTYTDQGGNPCCRACTAARDRERHARRRERRDAEERAAREAEAARLPAVCYQCRARCRGDLWCVGKDERGKNVPCPLCPECHAQMAARQRLWRAAHPPVHVHMVRGMGAGLTLRWDSGGDDDGDEEGVG